MHGGTATKPISLELFLEAIRDAAFVNSHAPVIITLDNHTKEEGQKQIAKLLRDVLGDALYVPEAGLVLEWPCPGQLLRQFLIRDKPQKLKIGAASGSPEDKQADQSQ